MKSPQFKILPISHNSKLRVAILGGSFNPAHEGHLHISKNAIKQFNFDFVIWFVTPQNPLKKLKVTHTLEERVRYAKKIAKHPKIIVSDFEKYLPNTYTITLLKRLKTMYPKVKFSWIMGADNISKIHHWLNWKKIFELVPVLVFDRENYQKDILSARIGKIFRNTQFKATRELENHTWYFLKIRKNNLSSTKIRNG